MSSETLLSSGSPPVEKDVERSSEGPRDTKTPSGATSGRLTIHFMDRGLGNYMFMYAGLLGVSKLNKLQPFIYNKTLESIFELGDTVELCSEEPDFPSLKTIYEAKICAYDSRFENLVVPEDGTVSMYAYLQSWRYFENCKDQVKRHFKFKREVQSKVDAVFQSLGLGAEYTLVAIQVRRGDLLEKKWVDKGYMVPDQGYFSRAMSYFRGRYNSVKFLVCSNDMEWTKSNITAENDDVVFVCGNPPEVDLGVMARCDHCIMSVGTYGWWAGWLAGGEVVYYKTPAVPGSEIHRHFVFPDYYPAEWKAME